MITLAPALDQEELVYGRTVLGWKHLIHSLGQVGIIA